MKIAYAIINNNIWMPGEAAFTRVRLFAIMSMGLAGTCLTLATAGAQQSSNRDVVLELFTSQGCKSCPQADANIAELAENPNVLALSFNVNYWDYLGWRDTLATQDNTDRQNAYRDSFNAKMVYTPQLIINGSAQMNGGDAGEIAPRLEDEKLTIPIEIKQSDTGRLTISIDAGEKPSAPVHVTVFYIRDKVTSEITKGDNAGKQVVYRNSVSDINTIGIWDGDAISFELPASELKRKDVTGCAVVLQEYLSDKSLGPILGAALFVEG